MYCVLAPAGPPCDGAAGNDGNEYDGRQGKENPICDIGNVRAGGK